MLNRNQLKLLALTTMLIDHLGYFIFDNNLALRCIGRLSFPLFVFLLVDGFRKTRDLSKYARRVLLFWVVSVVPYSLAFYRAIYTSSQNIYASLFLYLVLFCILEDKALPISVKAILAALAACTATVIHLEYGWYGVVVAVILFSYRDLGREDAFVFLFAAGMILGITTGMPICIFASLIVLLLPEDGNLAQCERPSKLTSALMYIFYPLHLSFFAMLIL